MLNTRAGCGNHSPNRKVNYENLIFVFWGIGSIPHDVVFGRCDQFCECLVLGGESTSVYGVARNVNEVCRLCKLSSDSLFDWQGHTIPS